MDASSDAMISGVVHGDKRVGLNRQPGFLREASEHQAGVIFVALKFQRHGRA